MSAEEVWAFFRVYPGALYCCVGAGVLAFLAVGFLIADGVLFLAKFWFLSRGRRRK